MDDLTGKRVSHKKKPEWGIGCITSQKGQYITVHFEKDTVEERKFSYPSSFELFLEMVDNLDKEKAAEDLSVFLEDQRIDSEKRRIEAEKRSKQIQYEPSPMKSLRKNSKDPADPPVFRTVDDFCQAFASEILSEIYVLKDGEGKKIHLTDGHFITAKEKGPFYYSFETDDDLSIPAGTIIQLWKDNERYPGEIIGCEESIVYLSSSVNLGNDVLSIDITADPWKLLQALLDRIEEMKKQPSVIVNDLILHGHEQMTGMPLNKGQEKAVELTQAQPITFIWGPPGTGKTTTLEKIAREYMRRGKRVLMVSYSNVSVDGAVKKFIKPDSDVQPGTIFRYGYPKDKELLSHEYLNSFNYVLSSNKRLKDERDHLLEEKRKFNRPSDRSLQISRRLGEIRKELLEQEKMAIQKANFVATTVSKAIVDSAIYDSRFDAVIMDEASMSLIPQVIFAASLAQEHFVCMGDFMQLPPIVQSEKAPKLKHDIFNYVGIEEAVFSHRSHKWLCMLNTQFRMNPEIASIASESMYHGNLESSLVHASAQSRILNQHPFAGKPVSMIDLSGTLSVCTKTEDGSRINPLSAFVSMGMALSASKNAGVGIITPYRSQAKLIRAMIKDLGWTNAPSIACATVHQFQGSEKDVIIYDAVDCFRMPYPGTLLTSQDNNIANKLFNVALTRSIGKFIGVANIDFFERKNLSRTLMFRHTMDYAGAKDSVKAYSNLLVSSELPERQDNLAFYSDQSTAQQSFIAAVQNARSEVRIDIPGECNSNEFYRELAQALLSLKKKGVAVYVRVETKKNLFADIKKLAIENPFIATPVSIIDRSETWYGMPASDTEFISEGVKIPTIHKAVVQFIGKRTAAALISFLRMNQTIESIRSVDEEKRTDDPVSAEDNLSGFVYHHKKCKVCGEPMKFIKSKMGKFSLACSNSQCQNHEFVTTELIDDYLFRDKSLRTGQKCPQCNCSMEAKLGRYGVYVRCLGIEHHIYRLDQI